MSLPAAARTASKALDSLNHLLRRRAVVFLISDFQSAAQEPGARYVRSCSKIMRQIEPPPRSDRDSRGGPS